MLPECFEPNFPSAKNFLPEGKAARVAPDGSPLELRSPEACGASCSPDDCSEFGTDGRLPCRCSCHRVQYYERAAGSFEGELEAIREHAQRQYRAAVVEFYEAIQGPISAPARDRLVNCLGVELLFMDPRARKSSTD